MNHSSFIIDTDCGMDDIMAMSMILYDGKINIAGISTVNGLVDPVKGAKNLACLMAYFGKDVAICAGARQSLSPQAKENMFPAEDRKKSTELSFLFPFLQRLAKQRICKMPVEEWLYQQCLKNPKNTEILCIGPLTNIAKTMKRYGMAFTSNIRKLTIMGGTLYVKGNASPKYAAEYNVFLDPDAARIVFSSNIPIDLISMDATKFVPVKRKFSRFITKIQPTNKFGTIVKQILLNNETDFLYFYDPLAAASLINPRIISFSNPCSLSVTHFGSSLGKVTIRNKNIGNIRYVTKVNANEFYRLVTKTVKG